MKTPPPHTHTKHKVVTYVSAPQLGGCTPTPCVSSSIPRDFIFFPQYCGLFFLWGSRRAPHSKRSIFSSLSHSIFLPVPPLVLLHALLGCRGGVIPTIAIRITVAPLAAVHTRALPGAAAWWGWRRWWRRRWGPAGAGVPLPRVAGRMVVPWARTRSTLAPLTVLTPPTLPRRVSCASRAGGVLIAIGPRRCGARAIIPRPASPFLARSRVRANVGSSFASTSTISVAPAAVVRLCVGAAATGRMVAARGSRRRRGGDGNHQSDGNDEGSHCWCLLPFLWRRVIEMIKW